MNPTAEYVDFTKYIQRTAMKLLLTSKHLPDQHCSRRPGGSGNLTAEKDGTSLLFVHSPRYKHEIFHKP